VPQVPLIDLTLGLSNQSWSLLHALSDLEPSEVVDPGGEALSCSTSPWYNGRERGFRLIFRLVPRPPYLAVLFAECRNTDQIVVYLQRGEGFQLNPDELRITDEAWRSQSRFACLDIGEARKFIVGEVAAWAKGA